jgi:prepilin-type N-terminal cleavage/methylation domain-containing protein
MKKGFTLIELLLSLMLFSVIMAGEIAILSSTLNMYKKEVVCKNESIYLDELLYFIEQEVKCSYKVEVNGDSVKFYKLGCNYDYEEVYCENNTLKISYFRENGNRLKRDSITHINNLEIISHGKIIYITITGINGGKIGRCCVIKNGK